MKRRRYVSLTAHELYIESRMASLNDLSGCTNEIKFGDLYEECEFRERLDIWNAAFFDAMDIRDRLDRAKELGETFTGVAQRIDFMTQDELINSVVKDVLEYACVEGNSMQPTLRSGEWVVYKKTDSFNDGDIVVVEIQNHKMIKRFEHSPDGYLLKSDNAVFPTMLIPFEENLVRHGVVIEARREVR